MKYELTTVELVTYNNETKEYKDIREFERIEAAKHWVDQTILALQYNVKQHCARKVDITENWTKNTNGTLTKSVYYDESDKLRKNILWIIKDISYIY